MRPPGQKPKGEADSNSISPHALNVSGLQSDADMGLVYRYAQFTQHGKVTGVNQTFTVWEPSVDQNARQLHSVQQDWLMNSDQSQVIETGIIVKPLLYGDSKPHFFIFYTPNKYRLAVWDTGGGAFVVANDAPFVPGAAQQVGTTVELNWLLSRGTGDWFLFDNDKLIGFYPASVFEVDDANGQKQPGPLTSGADAATVGGEVVSLEIPGAQTSLPQMGNGIRGNAPGAASITKISFIDLLGTPFVPHLTPRVTSPCYDLSPIVPGETSVIFFGGPGGFDC